MMRSRVGQFFQGTFTRARAFLAPASSDNGRARRIKFRPLRLEPCEGRQLLATIGGVVYNDLTGSGLTPDDPPWTVPPQAAPVTFNLYRQVGGNWVLDQTTTTDLSTGAYEFDIPAPGNDGDYYLEQLPVPNTATTAGQTPYFFSIVNDTVMTAGAILIDGFEIPTPAEPYWVWPPAVNPLTVEHTGPQIIGGQRDMTVEVLGAVGFLSAFGEIGAGNVVLATAEPGTTARWLYAGTAASPGLYVDLTAGGVNHGLRVDFGGLQIGGAAEETDYRLEVTHPTMGTVSVSGMVHELLDPDDNFIPFSLNVPFSAFSAPSGFFTNVYSVEFFINESGIPHMDLELNAIVAGNPLAPDYAITYVSSLSGFTYVDSNNNGIFDPGEYPLENTTITLTGTNNLGQSVDFVTTTGANGQYLFSGLIAASGLNSYTITESQPWAYVHGKDTIGTPGGQTAPNQFYGIQLPAGYTGVGNNFGELRLIDDLVTKRLFVWGVGWGTGQPLYDGSANPPVEGQAAIPMGVAATNVDTVEGTPGSDRFEFIGNPSLGGSVLKVNGVATAINPALNTLYLDGLGGNDTFTFKGTAGEETAELWGDSGSVISQGWVVNVARIESIEIDGLGGNDSATLHDSEGDDELIASPRRATMTFPTGAHRISGFETISAVADHGGRDVARLDDSPGNDRFVTAPRYGLLRGDGFSLRASGFGTVRAYATAGGYDIARIYDSAGDDLLRATPVAASLGPAEGGGFSSSAEGFAEVHVVASAGGHDVAMLFDSSGDDAFYASPGEGAMSGRGFSIRVRGFEEIRGDASSGGNDTAALYDSPGSDVLVASPGSAELFGEGYRNQAANFARVEALATAADGRDSYDLARLFGSAGDDAFFGSRDESTMSGPGYSNVVRFFETVEAVGSGGDDRARLVDSVGDDRLTAEDDWARLAFDVGSLRIADFDGVLASSTLGGNDARDVRTVDFLLTFEGSWT